MPLSDANFIQENTGSSGGTTNHVVSLVSGTTAGSSVIVIFGTSGVLPSPPAGGTWVLDRSVNSNIGVFRLPEAAASETSWTFTTITTAVDLQWYAAEVTGLDLVDPFDATASSTGNSITNGGTMSTGTATGPTAGLDVVAFAIFDVTSSATWSGYTNGFTEVIDNAGASASLAVARKYVSGTTATLECTATSAVSGTQTGFGAIASYRAQGAPVVAPLVWFAGFDWGTSGGLQTGGANSLWGSTIGPAGGTWNTNYLVQAGSARNSTHGLRIVQSANAVYAHLGNAGSSIKSLTAGLNVRVVSATGTVAVSEFTDQAGSVRWAQLLYDASTTKFGVRAGTTGTVSWQSGTTALNTWVWIDWRCRINSSTWQVDWRIETGTNTYTDETSATLSGQSTGNTFSSLHLGANQSQTVTVDFDDVVFSRYWSAFPLGPHQVKILTVDPAGTPSVSGTTTNFNVFTANGTLAAWNATNARNAVDEVPPTVSASADGVCQVSVAASDYMEFPMATHACTATEFINGVRMLAPAWGGTGTGTGTLGIRGYDGTTETILIPATTSYDAGSPTAVSGTEPLWQCAMWQSINGWTQAELDAAALRVGFSTDATPDMGVDAIYLEVAIGKTTTRTLFGSGATAEVDPTRLGTVSIATTAPVMGTGNTVMEYEIGGTPTQVPITEGATNTTQLNGVFESDVERVTVYWPPEPDPIA